MKIFIDAEAAVFNWISGGIIVLHKLGKTLADAGCDVYIVAYSGSGTLPESKAKIITRNEINWLCNPKEDLAIYPEITIGNPYHAKYVARWILYHPGVIAGSTTYDQSEYVFHYQKRFVEDTEYRDSPQLFVLQTNVDSFYPMNMERNHDAIMIKKATLKKSGNFEDRQKYFNDDLVNLPKVNFDYLVDSNPRLDPPNLNNAFNQVRYFVSYDPATYHSIMAALAGCISVVIPVDGLSKEEWKKQLPVAKYGVAYGFDDIEWAMSTVNDLRNMLIQMEQDNATQVNNFIDKVQSKWNVQLIG